MRYNALTHIKAKTAEAGKYADGRGLWLIKRNKTFGKWVLRLTHHAKRREMGLGRFPDVSIGEARTSAEAARKALRGGDDPIFNRVKERRAQRPLTLKEAVESCFEARKAELKRDGEAGRWMSPLAIHISQTSTLDSKGPS